MGIINLTMAEYSMDGEKWKPIVVGKQFGSSDFPISIRAIGENKLSVKNRVFSSITIYPDGHIEATEVDNE